MLINNPTFSYLNHIPIVRVTSNTRMHITYLYTYVVDKECYLNVKLILVLMYRLTWTV